MLKVSDREIYGCLSLSLCTDTPDWAIQFGGDALAYRVCSQCQPVYIIVYAVRIVMKPEWMKYHYSSTLAYNNMAVIMIIMIN